MLAHFNCADAGVLGRFLAVCLLCTLILGAVFDWLLAIGVGLLIAACYVVGAAGFASQRSTTP